MNRSLMVGLLAGLTTIWVAPAALAQKSDDKGAGRAAGKADKGEKPDKGEKGEKGERAKGEKGDRSKQQKHGGGLEGLLKAMGDDLKLSEQQAGEIKKLFAKEIEAQKKAKSEQSQQVSESDKKALKDLQAQLKQAKENKDAKKLEEIMQKAKDLRGDSRDKSKVSPGFLEAVAKELKDDQKDKFWELAAKHLGQSANKDALGKLRSALKKLDLSKDQQQAIDKIVKDFEKQNAGALEKGGDEAKELLSKLRQEIEGQLTGPQKSALREAMKGQGKGEGKKSGKAQGAKEKGAAPGEKKAKNGEGKPNK